MECLALVLSHIHTHTPSHTPAYPATSADAAQSFALVLTSAFGPAAQLRALLLLP